MRQLGNAHPADNSWFNTAGAGQVVKFTLDTNDYGGNAGLAWLPATNIVNVWDTLPHRSLRWVTSRRFPSRTMTRPRR